MTDHGVIRDRTAEFNWTIWDHLKWLCRFVAHVDSQSTATINQALADPLKFHELAAGTPEDQPALRRSIEYLVWPSYFEPVVADVERREIRDAFASLVGGAKGDTDEDITADVHRIRLHLDEQAGQRIDWYSRQLVSQWRKVGGIRAVVPGSCARITTTVTSWPAGLPRKRPLWTWSTCVPSPPALRLAWSSMPWTRITSTWLRGTRRHQDGCFRLPDGHEAGRPHAVPACRPSARWCGSWRT